MEFYTYNDEQILQKIDFEYQTIPQSGAIISNESELTFPPISIYLSYISNPELNGQRISIPVIVRFYNLSTSSPIAGYIQEKVFEYVYDNVLTVFILTTTLALNIPYAIVSCIISIKSIYKIFNTVFSFVSLLIGDEPTIISGFKPDYIPPELMFEVQP